MNQLALSTDLTVITAEINSFKLVVGQAVFEIGKRLKHVKQNDLAHGEFGIWVKTEIGITPSQASHFISAFDQFGELPMSASLQASKIFEMLSLPESVDRAAFIETPHIVPSNGESKTVEQMTVKETREVTKAVKELEKQLEQAELAKQQALSQQATLLAQIEQLKLVKDPESLKRIAELEEQVNDSQQLNSENVVLSRKNQELSQQLQEKSTAEKAIGKLRERCVDIMRSVAANHTAMMMELSNHQGHADTAKLIEDYGNRLSNFVHTALEDLKGLSQVKKTKGVIIDVE